MKWPTNSNENKYVFLRVLGLKVTCKTDNNYFGVPHLSDNNILSQLRGKQYIPTLTGLL